MLTINQLRQELKVSYWRLWNAIHEGAVPSQKIGTTYVIAEADLPALRKHLEERGQK